MTYVEKVREALLLQDPIWGYAVDLTNWQPPTKQGLYKMLKNTGLSKDRHKKVIRTLIMICEAKRLRNHEPSIWAILEWLEKR